MQYETTIVSTVIFVIIIFLRIDSDAVKISYVDANADAIIIFCRLPVYFVNAHISKHIFCCYF